MEYDEELYIAGNMVIWSKGSKNQASAVYKAFTVDSPVLQVWKLTELQDLLNSALWKATVASVLVPPNVVLACSQRCRYL